MGSIEVGLKNPKSLLVDIRFGYGIRNVPYCRQSFIIFLISLTLMGGCAMQQRHTASGDFAAAYRAHQEDIYSAQAALNMKDYVAAIEHYSRAIS